MLVNFGNNLARHIKRVGERTQELYLQVDSLDEERGERAVKVRLRTGRQVVVDAWVVYYLKESILIHPDPYQVCCDGL